MALVESGYNVIFSSLGQSILISLLYEDVPISARKRIIDIGKNVEKPTMRLLKSCFTFILATGLIINSGDRLLLPILPFWVLFFIQILEYALDRGRLFRRQWAV